MMLFVIIQNDITVEFVYGEVVNYQALKSASVLSLASQSAATRSAATLWGLADGALLLSDIGSRII